MNPERFKDSSSGRLVKAASLDGETYWAFAPNPLPPEWQMDPELILTLSEADRALGELAGLGRVMPNPRLIISPFMRREAVLSSRIEGTQTDIADLYAYEAGQLTLPGIKQPPPKSDTREVANYVRALEYGLKRVETSRVSLQLIRELHERLLDGNVRGANKTPGEFRTIQNYIGGRQSGGIANAEFVPPSVIQMRDALQAFENYLQFENGHPPLVRLALIHYHFEAIHPFIDGNGRVGRLLISLLLAHWNLLPLPLLYLSAYFERERETYYDLLLAVSERGAWTEWVSFFLAGVTEQSNDAISRAKKLQDLQMDWKQRLQKKPSSSARALQLADSLFDLLIITIPDARKILDVSYVGAKNNVQKLVESDILIEVAATHPKMFLSKEILEIISDAGKQA